MAMGMKAWIEFANDNPEEALATLGDVKEKSITIEKSLDEAGVPKSEYPRALLRYVEGLIQWDMAKELLSNGDEAGAKRLAAQSAGNLYNTFLKYEGNDYADRAAVAFEDLKIWIKESFGTDISQKKPSPRVLELMFKRELDLAKKLYLEGRYDDAERNLLAGLSKYPDTKYTLTALDTLSQIWISQDQDWELMALTSQVAAEFPDQEEGGRILLRVGKKMADDENLIGVEQVLGDFGRNYPSHPSAPGMLFKIGKAASDRGEQGLALEVYNDILTLYPESNFAVAVLQIRAEEASKAENYEEEILAFEMLRDQTRDPVQAAFAELRIADAKLNMQDPEAEKEAVNQLTALRAELENQDSDYYKEGREEKTLELLQNVRYLLSQIMLRQAGREADDQIRAQAAQELNSFLADYPDSKTAPDVMYNLGRLYLQQGQFDEATRTFETLSEKYPESEAGKDALYSLVKAAIEEEQLDLAGQAVQKMVAQPESYEIEKIYRVAQLMLTNELWMQAQESYALVLDSERTQDDDSMRQRALNGMGEAARGAGDIDAAAESFQTLIDEYPTSTLVMDAGVSLAELYLAKDPPEPANARKALGAVSRILRSRSDKIGKAKLDIALGNVFMAEGNPGAALANWYGVGLTEPDSEALGALVRESIQLALAQAQEEIDAGNANRWNLVIELTDQYLKNFPMDNASSDMRSLNVRAIAEAPTEN